MSTKIILEELEFINQLLDVSLGQMEEILRPKTSNVMWRLFFPAGQFIQQKSLARETSRGLLKMDTRLKEMETVLEERNHPLKKKISKILARDLITMSEKLVELPERAQYMITQIEDIKRNVEQNILEISN